jgi:hypothetical protein
VGYGILVFLASLLGIAHKQLSSFRFMSIEIAKKCSSVATGRGTDRRGGQPRLTLAGFMIHDHLTLSARRPRTTHFSHSRSNYLKSHNVIPDAG